MRTTKRARGEAMLTPSPKQRPFARIASATASETRPFAAIERNLSDAAAKRARRAAKRRA